MLTAMLALKNILTEKHDYLWEVNTKRSYHEEFMVKLSKKDSPLPLAK
jgi:hypothetical protein